MEQTTNLKNKTISEMIQNVMLYENLDLPQAFDKILGEGAYKKLANELYDALQNN